MGSYAIAYADKNGNGFSNDEPWIEAGFEKDLGLCKRRAIEMVKHGLKKVTVFKFGSQLCDTYSWNYIKEHVV